MVDLYTGTVPNLTQSQPEFDENTQGILDYIAGLAPQLNEWVGAYVQDTTSASATSNTIGTGSKTFTVESGKGYKVNMPVRASATSGNYMDGIVTAYSGTSLTINFASSNGSGTFTSWNIFLTVPGSNVTLGSNTFIGDQIVPDESYDASGWNGDLSVPTKNAVRDKIELLLSSYVTETSDPSYADDTSNPASTDWVNGKALITRTATVTLSGSASYDIFSAIPNGVKRVTLELISISTTGTSGVQVLVGDTGIISTGYAGVASNITSTTSYSVTQLSNGIDFLNIPAATNISTGILTFNNIPGNNWIFSGQMGVENATRYMAVIGNIALTSALKTVRVKTGNGTDTFDGGTAVLTWEY